jgi:hypothetical protein
VKPPPTPFHRSLLPRILSSVTCTAANVHTSACYGCNRICECVTCA